MDTEAIQQNVNIMPENFQSNPISVLDIPKDTEEFNNINEINILQMLPNGGLSPQKQESIKEEEVHEPLTVVGEKATITLELNNKHMIVEEKHETMKVEENHEALKEEEKYIIPIKEKVEPIKEETYEPMTVEENHELMTEEKNEPKVEEKYDSINEEMYEPMKVEENHETMKVEEKYIIPIKEKVRPIISKSYKTPEKIKQEKNKRKRNMERNKENIGGISKRRLKTPRKIQKGSTPIILRTRAALALKSNLKLKLEDS